MNSTTVPAPCAARSVAPEACPISPAAVPTISVAVRVTSAVWMVLRASSELEIELAAAVTFAAVSITVLNVLEPSVYYPSPERPLSTSLPDIM